MTRLLSAVITTMAVMLFAGGAALAQPTVRAGTIPGLDFAGLTVTGDLWTFKCPRNGTFTISVDTAEDTSAGESLVDPQILVHDGAGIAIAGEDDNQACSHAPVCGFACPAVNNISCGTGSVHSVSVASGSNESQGCPGGTYYLSVEAFDSNGNSVGDRRLKLGGGARNKVPRWFDRNRKSGPAIDDGILPN